MNDLEIKKALKRVYKRYIPELSDDEHFKELFEKYFTKTCRNEDYKNEFILVEKYIMDNFDYAKAWTKCSYQEFKPHEWWVNYLKLITKWRTHSQYTRKDLVKKYHKYQVKLAVLDIFSRVINTLKLKIDALREKGYNEIRDLSERLRKLTRQGKTDTLEYKDLFEKRSRFK